MFDLLSINEGADLASDLNEFNDFYLNDRDLLECKPTIDSLTQFQLITPQK